MAQVYRGASICYLSPPASRFTLTKWGKVSNVSKTADDFFIVDNSDEHWKALEYIKQWCEISREIDIATGYFEVGALLRLDGHWQKVDKIRILLGSETSQATVDTIRKAKEILNASAESETQQDPFLSGLGGIIEGMRTGKIEVRVFKQKKFHAKTYITHGRLDIVGSAALVGSSNFTPAGLTRNIELNVRFTGTEVRQLQDWFENYWERGEDIIPEVLDILDKYTKAYTPLEIYAKSLSMLTKDVEPGATEWEITNSKIYPMLAPYQREAYHGMKQRASKWRGAFLTDGVGLGKTFVGLMLAEYFAVKERKKVLILATKTGVDSVWNPELKAHLRHLTGSFASIEVMAHTDFSKSDALEKAAELAERVDVIIIDEAHNFRNRGLIGDNPDAPKSRWWRLQQISKGKTVFNLTATPINNDLFDFVNQVEIFTNLNDAHFSSIGIPNLRQHVQAMENEFEDAIDNAQGQALRIIDVQDFQALVKKSPLLKELIVQNSRDYAIKSAKAVGDENVRFPATALPRAVPYSYTEAFAQLLGQLEGAFQRSQPLFTLPMYYPLSFAREASVNKSAQNRQAQVVGLIRTIFLKRFESSIAAFAGSCADLAGKIAMWISLYSASKPDADAALTAWKVRAEPILNGIHKEFRPGIDVLNLDFDEDSDPFEVEGLGQVTDAEYHIDEMLKAAFEDLEQLTQFMITCNQVGSRNDNKISQLCELLDSTKGDHAEGGIFDPAITKHKVLIFTEYADTARYIESRLKESGVRDVDRIDGSRKASRYNMVRRFSPHYNKVDSQERRELQPIRVLVSTDVLSEGVNLQDASIIVNYDIHWNPVRLMQRIGRVDRRLNPDIETELLNEDPSQKELRGNIFIRNFLPPKELNRLLSLYSRVQGRTVRISSTLGIPGGRLLDENDELDDVKVFESFQAEYMGQISFDEQLRLHLLDLLKTHPELETTISDMPLGAHSAKKTDSPVVFECSIEPVRIAENQDVEAHWSIDEGRVRWSMQMPDGTLTHDLKEIDKYIRSDLETKTLATLNQEATAKSLNEIRSAQMNDLSRSGMPLDAPLPRVICWMEGQ